MTASNRDQPDGATFTATFEGDRAAAVQAVYDVIDAKAHHVRLYPDLYADDVLTALGWAPEAPDD